MTAPMRPPRRAAALLGTTLLAALLPVLLPTAPAAADSHCVSEAPEAVPPSACDDSTPPETTFGGATPAPNAAGWTKTDTITFTFAAVPDEGDTDDMELECKLEGPGQTEDWSACTSPQSYTDLDDTAVGYTFSVRAFDSTDRAIDYDDPSTVLVNEDEVPDEDPTPETFTWKQDTVKPVVLLFNGPPDEEGTGWPIASKPTVRYELGVTDEGDPSPTPRCQLDGATRDCEEGVVTLRNVAGGHHVLTVSATDAAGNTATQKTGQFTMPFDLGGGDGWKRREASGYFDRDYLQASTPGALVKFKARNVREVRLIAPSGPTLGKVRVRVGDGPWRTIDLSGPADTSRHYQVRGPGTQTFSGPIQVESLSRRAPVRVDALVFPNT